MGLITQNRKEEKRKRRFMGMGGTTPSAGAEEMLQQFRAFATLEENQVWFPIPT